MGLDMYLIGEKWLPIEVREREDNKIDGFEVQCHSLRLGYWRKHPNLHGYIVQKFADGVDDCTRIPLDSEDIEDIVRTVKSGLLPETTGFFFGKSTGDEAAEDIEIFTKALAWLKNGMEDRTVRSVYYEASW